jgi:hypothetical protein
MLWRNSRGRPLNAPAAFIQKKLKNYADLFLDPSQRRQPLAIPSQRHVFLAEPEILLH